MSQLSSYSETLLSFSGLLPGTELNLTTALGDCPLNTPFSCLCFYKSMTNQTNAVGVIINKFAGWEVRIVKNCERGLENAALGLRPRAAFSRPRSQFFTLRADLSR